MKLRATPQNKVVMSMWKFSASSYFGWVEVMNDGSAQYTDSRRMMVDKGCSSTFYEDQLEAEVLRKARPIRLRVNPAYSRPVVLSANARAAISLLNQELIFYPNAQGIPPLLQGVVRYVQMQIELSLRGNFDTLLHAR